MTFYEMLDQAIVMLQRRGRLTYRTLKRHFHLDAEELEDLTFELIKGQRLAVDEDGAVLVWTGEPLAAEPGAQSVADAEMRFHTLLPAVIGLLQNQRRVTYRTLTYIFGIDEMLLGEIREDLHFRRLAIDEDGKGLVWIGETPPSVQRAAATPCEQAGTETTAVPSPAASTLPPPVTETRTPSHGPTAIPEAMSTDSLQDETTRVTTPVRSAPEAERRQLTVMFCDLADSTKLSQQLDPEDLREVIRAYQETAAEIIHQYEGTIAQYLGDGLLIYIGWPRAHEDDARRALHAGLGIVEAITTTLNPRLEREKGVQLAVRLGVHTGPVVVGEMGGGGRQEKLATGETVNIAARLEGLAAPNTVVISHVTARLVQRAFALEDLGPQVLKGVAEPLGVFRVLGPVKVHEDATSALGVPFLVGRDEEMGLLLRRWEQSKEGLGQVVLISGEAGIGKSSLVTMMRAHVEGEGYTRLTSRCSPYHTNSALSPVITHLEHMLGFDRDDPPDIKLDKLEQALRTTSLPLDATLPLLATLLSVPFEERYAALSLSPQQQRQQTLDALVGWLLEEAGRQPVLAVWEDLHWADPSTLELLALVLEQTPTVPMLHVLTYRPEFELPWPTRSHMTPLTLNRLERPQVEALITHLAGGKALPAEVVEHIVSKTDGVPLYVEELTKMLLESDLLREEAEQYVLTGPLLSVSIPDTLQDSLMARLDQMQTAKEIAQLGAALGREFPYDLIQAISSQDDETLQTGLSQLVEAELLYRRGRPPRAKYIFKHALIQDAAYASLLRSTRQQLHQQIAQRLEAGFAETVETQPELVAHHYTDGGCPEQAIRYWHQAGLRAVERSAYVEALAHLMAGLALLPQLPDTPARTQQELVLQLALGPVLAATKGNAAPEVGRAYRRARSLCQELGDTPHHFPVLVGLWRFAWVQDELLQAHELGLQLLDLAERVHDAELLLEAQRALGLTLFFLGDLSAARLHLEQGVGLYHPEQHRDHAALYGRDPGVDCHAYMAMTLGLLGYPDQALSHMHTALTLSEQLASPLSRGWVLAFTAWLHQFHHARRLVQEWSEAAIELGREHRFPQVSAMGSILHGWVCAIQGEEVSGIAEMRQGLADWQATGAAIAQPYYLALLADWHGTVGQGALGLEVLVEARDTAQHHQERFYEAEFYRLEGELLLTQAADRAAEAAACFQQALTIARRQQAKWWELRAAISLARLWQQQNKRQDAYALLTPVYEWFTEGFDTADLQEAKALLDELAR